MPLVSELLPILAQVIHAANALLEWLMTYAIHSTILIGGLLLLTSTAAGRRLVAGHGSWLWRFALVGALVTASLQSIRSTAPLTGTLRLNGDEPARTMVRIEMNHQSVAPTLVTGVSHRAVTSASIDVNPKWPLLALGAWFIGAATMLGWFLIARSRFLRAIGPRSNAGHTLAGNALRHLLREGRIDRPVRLTRSDCLTSPVALGGDEICLPSRALSELDPIRMESIIAHELAHLVRRDPSWLTIACVIEAIFFFQPLNGLARRRMQESAEFASDAWASTRVARPLDLAHCLARVAEWTIAAPRLPVPAMAEGHGPGRRGAVLVRRVERLTTGRVIPESIPGRGLRLTAVATLLGLILMAPRAAVGADRSAARLMGARIPAQIGVFSLQRMLNGPVNPGPRRQAKTVLLRVTR